MTNLREAAEIMAEENIDVLPVVSSDNKLISILSYKNILSVYKKDTDEHQQQHPNISIKRGSIKVLIRGQQLMTTGKRKKA